MNTTITSASTTIVLATAATHPTCSTTPGTYPVTIQIDAEQITLTAAPGGSTSPQTFTGITRGVNGTTAAGHTAGAVVTVVQYGLLTY